MSIRSWRYTVVRSLLSVGGSLLMTGAVLVLMRISWAAPATPPVEGTPLSFGEPTPIFTPTTGVGALAWGYLDGDRFPDLAFAAADQVWITSGTGATFTGWLSPVVVGNAEHRINELLVSDLDRDAHPDVVVLSGGMAGGQVRLWRNPEQPFDSAWNEVGLVAASTAITYAAGAVGDLDGDAAPDLVAGCGDGVLRLWRNPMSPGAPFTADWGTPMEIALSSGPPRAVELSDLDRDGWLDILVVAGDGVQLWQNPGHPFGGAWTTTVTLSGPGSALRALFVADLDGDGRPDPVAGDRAGNLLAWSNPLTPGVAFAGGWPSAAGVGQIGEAVLSLGGADLDHDGAVDLVAGGGGPTHTVTAWFNGGAFSTAWQGRTLGARADDLLSLLVVDADTDGDPDLISGSGAGDAAQLVWWPNTLIHRAAPLSAPLLPVGESAADVETLVRGDLNRDGWPDLVSGDTSGEIVIWENDHDPMGGPWSRHVVGQGSALMSLALCDLDRDGDLEIVSGHAAPPRLLIWRNQGSSLDGPWISSSVGDPGAGVGGLAGADLDRDGWLDLVSGSGIHGDDPSVDHRVALWHNDGTPFDGPWAVADAAVMSYSVNAVAVGDLDRDGWLDIAVGTDRAPAVGSAVDPVPRAQWPDVFQLQVLRNSGAPFTDPWSVTIVGRDPTTVTLGPEEDPSHYHGYWGAAVYDVKLTDFDRDGDLDIVTADHIEADYQVKVWENDGTPFDGQPGTFHWTWQPVTVWYGRPPSPPWMGGSALSVEVADFNLDGWPDVVPGITSWLHLWFENSRHPFGEYITDTHWVRHTVAPSSVDIEAVVAGDYDRDGDPDVASGSEQIAGAEVVLWANGSGGVTLEASGTSLSPMRQGTTDDLLKIRITHHGYPEEEDVRWNDTRLRLTGPDGSPLTSGEANALIDRLWIYRDTGNNRWGTADTQVITVTDLVLDAAGYQTLSFGEGAPLTVVPPGGSATFFAVVELHPMAMYETPNAFQLWFDADALVEEVGSGARVAVSDAGAVGSGVMQIVGPPIQVLIEDRPAGTGGEVVEAAVASGHAIDLYAIGRDELGQYVAGQAVTWTLSTVGGGVAPGDLIPSPDGGQASLRGNLTGTARITIEHRTLGGDTTGLITVAPAPALMTLSADPLTVTANGVSTTMLSAVLQDVHGAPVVDGVPVTFTIVTGSQLGSLPTEPYVSETLDGEAMAVFTPGTAIGEVVLQAATRGLTDQLTVTLRPGPLAALEFVGYPSTIYAGWTFYRPPLLTALDAFGNVKVDYRGSIYFTTTDPQAMLSYTLDTPLTFTPEDMGQYRFDGSEFILGTAGFQVLTVTDSVVTATTEPIEVIPGLSIGRIELSLSHSVITAGLPVTCTVEAFDDYGNSRGDWTQWSSYTIEPEAGGEWAENVYTSDRDGIWQIVARAGYDPPRGDSVALEVVFDGQRVYLPLTVRGR